MEEDYSKMIADYQDKNIVTYHGRVDNIQEFIKNTHCTIHPSYHEGMSNVLLESSAIGRPILASDIPGCREIFDEGKSGYGFKPSNYHSLVNAIEKFLKLSYEEKKNMGL